MLPGKLRHHGKVHAVEGAYKCGGQKNSGDDSEDLNDLVLFDVEIFVTAF